MSKVTIIGAGSVGSTIAYTMVVNGIASEIVMIDVNEEKALGEAMDIRQGTPFCSPVSIYAGSYRDAVGSDIVIITSGVARKPGQTRIDLAQTNVGIIKSIAPNITKYAPNAVYILVANPVDILTYVFTKISGLPERQVIGSGTILDTARLRARLSEYLRISQKNVHAYVMGEHGDTSFIPWSMASVSSIPLDDYRKSIMGNEDIGLAPVFDREEIEHYMRTSGGKVIRRKGATFYAVSVSVCRLCSLLLSAYESISTVSSMLHGEYGIDDVCLSIPALIGPKGITGKVPVKLTEEEVEKLRHSADVLKDVIKQIEL